MEIKLHNCDVKVGNQVMLNKINFEIESKKFYHVMGENGSGKSIFLQSLLGLTAFSKGEHTIIYDKKDLCYITSIPFYFDNEKVSSVISLLRTLYRQSSENIIKILQILNLSYEDVKNKKMSELSQGMRQKITVMPLFFDQLSFFVLDEIFVGFDQKTQTKIVKQIELLSKKGNTIIFVEHNAQIINTLEKEIGMEQLICKNQKISSN